MHTCRVRFLRSSLAALLLIGAVNAAMVQPPQAGAMPTPSRVDSSSAPDEFSAGQIAESFGHDVEISSLTNATQQVFAQPDGQRRAVLSSEPQRVSRDGRWLPVDLSLATGPDGLSPRVAPVPVTFSGGGATALVTVRPDTAAAVTETWAAGPLPAPLVDGPRATYAEVLPGVDLVLTATVTGFAEALVVKDAVAARSPALEAVRFGVASTDTTSKAVAGGRDFTDAHGGRGMRIGAATWWDSRFADASATGPGGPGFSRSTPASIGESGIRLDAGAVARQPGLTFPVYIDPSYTFSGGVQAWTFVDTAGPTTSNWMGGSGNDGYAHVGYIDAAHSGGQNIKARAFWRMDTHVVAGKKVSKGEFDVKEVWASSCTTRAVELWTAGAISSGTTWNSMPGFSTKMDAPSIAYNWSSSGIGGPSGCARTSPVGFDATYAAQAAASRKYASVTLGMKASDETDWLSWKKFTGSATLVITYNSIPNVPTSLRTSSSTPCVTGTSRPTIGTLTPTLYATASDPDKGNLAVQFEWWSTGGSKVGSSLTGYKASGSTSFGATVPGGAFSNGANLSWRARSYDGSDYSAFSGWCELHLDAQVPYKPAVTSAANDFPDYNYFALQGIDPPAPPKHAGDTGSVTLSNGGSTDVRQYHYSVNGRPWVTVSPTVTGGSVTVSFAPGLPASWVNVYSTDAANNMSETSTYSFPLQPSDTLVSAWRLVTTDPADGKIHSSTGAAIDNPLTLREDAGITTGDVNSGPSIDFDETEGYFLHTDGVNDLAQTAGPVLDTSKSFSVVTRVRPDNASRGTYQTFASQWGSIDSSYYFQFTPTGAIRFGITTADTSTRSSTLASIQLSDIPARCGWQTTTPTAGDYWQVDAWHTFVGSYDAEDKRLQLWADDCPVPIAEATPTFAAWNAGGASTIGSSLTGSADASNMFAGGMSQLLMFQGIPTPDEIRTQLEAANV